MLINLFAECFYILRNLLTALIIKFYWINLNTTALEALHAVYLVHTSQQLPILIGVPQGSVLRSFLFLLYINNLPNCCDSKMVLYADDSVLLCTDKNKEKVKPNSAKSKNG